MVMSLWPSFLAHPVELIVKLIQMVNFIRLPGRLSHTLEIVACSCSLSIAI